MPVDEIWPGADERVRGDILATDLLARLRSVPEDQLDGETAAALKTVSASLGLDEAALVHWVGAPGTVVTRTWAAPGDALAGLAAGLWLHQHLSPENLLLLSSVEELPAEARLGTSPLNGAGRRSLAALPLNAGRHFAGAMVFLKAAEEEPWPQTLVRRLQAISEVFANLLDRRECNLEAEQELAGERLLAEIAAHLAAVPAAEMDPGIEHAQRLFCERLGLSLSCVFQASDIEPDILFLTHLHQAEDWLLFRRKPVSPLASSYWFSARSEAYLRVDAKMIPWIYGQLRRGETVVIPSVEDMPPEALLDKQVLQQYQAQSTVAVPMSVGGRFVGCLTFGSLRERKVWSEQQVRRFQLVANVFSNALARRRADQALVESNERLSKTIAELQAVQQRLRDENLTLTEEVHACREKSSMVGKSDALMRVINQAERVAATDSTVLILGETGTGKELLAQYIHRISARANKPFIATNIAAIPATLLESELFGREKGAYTGALTREVGRFQMADGGTLFLDEIGEMPIETQSKLLRVLQTGEFERLGSGGTIHVDVRVIAATNRDLSQLLTAGTFRQDLLYRLNVFPITLPPLRERREDIHLLVWTFVRELSKRIGRAFERIRKKDLEALQSYDWPGNIRELRNVVERSMILCEGPELRLILPDSNGGTPGGASRLLVDVERQHILKILEASHGRIRGHGGAAESLGIKPTTLYSLMARLGIGRGQAAGESRRVADGASANRCPAANA